jgi:hypothetical protein
MGELPELPLWPKIAQIGHGGRQPPLEFLAIFGSGWQPWQLLAGRVGQRQSTHVPCAYKFRVWLS